MIGTKCSMSSELMSIFKFGKECTFLIGISCTIDRISCSTSSESSVHEKSDDMHSDTGTTVHSEPEYSYEIAVSKEDKFACYYLAIMYDEGKGVQKDQKKAFDLYMKAANLGHSTSQYNVGVSYLKGEGVQPDKREAKEWFEKACNNGNQEGCDHYRELKYQGH